jgi:hypothetical protein
MTAISEHRNLKPWKPGRSGDLNGRLIGKSMVRVEKPDCSTLESPILKIYSPIAGVAS